ncbi:polysaccharide pyruvyl transferase family protein [Bacillus carboniphilus]|uniref:Polysaccharide pyruvyl transferase family protein n=1 Tax=Bacillus carboniphilus TaxID=86663 RepID=A0ABY9JTR9_9BACI|nr:polysaccharide pyruvyl transferase family protein [Bacillus carboniphilus]WLR42791.1 polysaccharide pyruvyl transferase family protein [Bacillus carboniphilus]
MNVLMFGHYGSLNRGCEAIVRSSASIIKERVDGAKVFLSSGRPETDKMITVLDKIYDGSEKEIHKFSLDWLVSALQYKINKKDSYALGKIYANTIKQVEDADVCLSIGGDNYCYGEQPGWYEINKRVKGKDKKLVLWGCSIGEEDMSSRKLDDLKQFDLILARETFTYNMLIEKGLKNVELCADAAFTLEKEELPLPDSWQTGNTIGINLSPLVQKRNPQSKEVVKGLIEHILKNTSMTIALTPHVIEHENNDYELLGEYFYQFKDSKRVLLLPDHLNAMQYKGYISRMRFFIGARTHATIAAYSSYVPTMVLGYSVKSRGISHDIFGETKLVLNIHDNFNESTIIKGFQELMRDEEVIKKKLKESIPKMKGLSYQAVDYLHGVYKHD